MTVVVPTRNERDNVAPLVEQLTAAFRDERWEVLFVDDSSDDTGDRIRALAHGMPTVRLHQRPVSEHSTGLGGAVASGFSLARGEVVVVMDGDLQHPPRLAPLLADVVARGAGDVAIASRYCPGGARGAGLASPSRVAASHLSRFTARALLHRARGVRDPLGGFFAVRRSLVDGASLQPRGYKILLEVLVRTPWATVVEVPYRFESRRAGSSKAGLREGARFGRHLATLVRAQRSGA